MGKNKDGKLTNLEKAFCAAVVSGSSYSDAYRATHKGANKLSSVAVSKKAAQFRREHPRVDAEIERLQNDAVSNAVISRDDLVSEIHRLFGAAVAASIRVDKVNGIEVLASDKAAGVALRASERLAKLLGYDAEEKVDAKITVSLSPEVEKYAK